MSLKAPYLPKPVSDLELAFPAGRIMSDLMPAMADIPEDFRRDRGNAREWVRFQQQWFFRGLKTVDIVAKPGIDRSAAIRHLAAIQGSYEPQHEHKEAAVAYLASLWLEPVEISTGRAS